MQIFGSILLVAVSYAFVLNGISNENLATPYVTNFTMLTPTNFFMQWKTVLSSDFNDPVEGYRVKIWRHRGVKYNHTEIIGKERIITITYEYPTFTGFKTSPGLPWQVLSVSNDKREVILNNLASNVLYDIRVQAFSKKGDGPLSNPRRLTIEKLETLFLQTGKDSRNRFLI